MKNNYTYRPGDIVKFSTLFCMQFPVLKDKFGIVISYEESLQNSMMLTVGEGSKGPDMTRRIIVRLLGLEGWKICSPTFWDDHRWLDAEYITLYKGEISQDLIATHNLLRL